MRRGGQGAERFVLIDPPASAHLHWRHVYQLCFIMGWMAALPFPIPGILNIQAGGAGGRGRRGEGGVATKCLLIISIGVFDRN